MIGFSHSRLHQGTRLAVFEPISRFFVASIAENNLAHPLLWRAFPDFGDEKEGMPMTTMMLEPTLLDSQNKDQTRAPNLGSVIQLWLKVRARKFFNWLTTPAPRVDAVDAMREYHHTKYMHFIHRM